MSNKFTKIYTGLVVDNRDFQNMGRLSVDIPELGTVSDNKIVVSYASPFMGSTDPSMIDEDNTQTFEGTQKSYGFWAVPPTINSLVLVLFVNGEPSRGYWFACIPQQFMNHMLPNIPVGDSYQHGKGIPVAEYNKSGASPNKHKGKRPYHKHHYETVRNQGLKDDKIRGFSQHGATSDIPSAVMGMLSPKGHYWSIEDTEGDSKFRIRTANGSQILLDDTNEIIYIINANGKSWAEMDATGKVMFYSEDSFAIRTKKDFSVRADRDIILESGRNIILRSEQNTKFENENLLSKSNDNVAFNTKNGKLSLSGKSLDIHIDGNINTLSSGSFNLGANASVNINATADLKLGGNNSSVLAQANLNLSANASASFSGNSSTIVSSSGMLGLTGSSILQNMGVVGQPAQPPAASSPKVVIPDNIKLFSKQDIEQPKSDDKPIISNVQTSVSTLPTHEPCPEHLVAPEDLGL